MTIIVSGIFLLVLLVTFYLIRLVMKISKEINEDPYE